MTPQEQELLQEIEGLTATVIGMRQALQTIATASNDTMAVNIAREGLSLSN